MVAVVRRSAVLATVVASALIVSFGAPPVAAAKPAPTTKPVGAAKQLPSASPISISQVQGAFYPNPNNSGSIDPTNLTVPTFGQQFPVIDFNPPASAQVNCSNSTGVNENTRPFTDVVPNPSGTCSTVVAQGNAAQAGVGPLSSFQAVFTSTLNVTQAGQITFNFFSDDGWVLGAGPRVGGSGAPQYLSGSLVNPPASTPIKNFAVVGSYNTNSSPAQNTVTVNFPSAGSYPIELDYTECCGGQLALTLGTTFGNPIPPGAGNVVPPDGLLAFGDSVAAGYGLGEADGNNNDNPSAYPAVLAAQLHLPYGNLAAAGACASTSDATDPYSVSQAYCSQPGQTPLDQQIQAAPSYTDVRPKLITVTIGANDIDFQGCFMAVVLGTYNDPNQDPCEPKTNLPANLAAFRTNVNSDLTALSTKYPGVPILLTGYYNPLPGGGQPLCDLDAAIGTWLYAKAAAAAPLDQAAEAFAGIFLRRDAFLAGLQDVQASIHNRANYILRRLDDVLKHAAAMNRSVHFAGVSFSGHDMCAGSNAWVFGPDLSVKVSFNDHTLSYNYAAMICPVPGVLEQTFPLAPPPLQLPGGNTATFNLLATTNCLPHPTSVGQTQLARQVFPTAMRIALP